MTQRSARRTWPLAVRCLPLLLALALCTAVPAGVESSTAGVLLVIVHKSVTEPQLDPDELRAVFLRKRLVWSNGHRVIPINYPTGEPVRSTFDQVVLGFSPEQTARYWIDARIRNGTQAPRSIPGDVVLVQVVSALPGSISYVPAGRLVGASGVRVIARIEGGRVLPP